MEDTSRKLLPQIRVHKPCGTRVTSLIGEDKYKDLERLRMMWRCSKCKRLVHVGTTELRDDMVS